MSKLWKLQDFRDMAANDYKLIYNLIAEKVKIKIDNSFDIDLIMMPPKDKITCTIDTNLQVQVLAIPSKVLPMGRILNEPAVKYKGGALNKMEDQYLDSIISDICANIPKFHGMENRFEKFYSWTQGGGFGIWYKPEGTLTYNKDKIFVYEDIDHQDVKRVYDLIANASDPLLTFKNTGLSEFYDDLYQKLLGKRPVVHKRAKEIESVFNKINGNSWGVFTNEMNKTPELQQVLVDYLTERGVRNYEFKSLKWDYEQNCYSEHITNIDWVPMILSYNSLYLVQTYRTEYSCEVMSIWMIFYNPTKNEFQMQPIYIYNKLNAYAINKSFGYGLKVKVITLSNTYPKNNNTVDDAYVSEARKLEDDLAFEDKDFEEKRKQLPASSFGLSSERKYPLYHKDGTPDEKHIKAAIRLFGHCEPKKKKQLAGAIYRACKNANIEIDESAAWYKYFKGKKVAAESFFIDEMTPYDHHCLRVQLESEAREEILSKGINDVNSALRKLHQFFNCEMVNVQMPFKIADLCKEITLVKSIPGITRESALFATPRPPKQRFSGDFVHRLANACKIITRESSIIEKMVIEDEKEFRIKAFLKI